MNALTAWLLAPTTDDRMPEEKGFWVKKDFLPETAIEFGWEHYMRNQHRNQFVLAKLGRMATWKKQEKTIRDLSHAEKCNGTRVENLCSRIDELKRQQVDFKCSVCESEDDLLVVKMKTAIPSSSMFCKPCYSRFGFK